MAEWRLMQSGELGVEVAGDAARMAVLAGKHRRDREADEFVRPDRLHNELHRAVVCLDTRANFGIVMLTFHGAGGKKIELKIIEAHSFSLLNLRINPLQRSRVCDVECARFILDPNRSTLLIAQRDLRKRQASLINRLRQ